MERFEELTGRISAKLRGLIYKIRFASSFVDEDDLYQEAVSHLWQRFRRGELGDKNESYILKSCYFHLKNYQRTELERFAIARPLEKDQEEEDAADPLEFIPQEGDTLEYLNARVLVHDIQNNGLTKREKEVFNLLLEGLTVREVGNRLGISHVRVVKIESHIRDKYKNRFQELPK
jgi:RNA polymerase sigma factor (sigma-70 family)